MLYHDFIVISFGHSKYKVEIFKTFSNVLMF